MPRWLKISVGLAALAGVLVWLLFLDNTGSVQGTKGGLPPATSEATEAPNIGVILPADGFAEVDLWEETARRQEGRTRAIATIYRMTPNDPPSMQVDLIHKAVSEGCSALIVLAPDGRLVAPAIAEVRKAGTPVVILAKPVDSEGLPPIPTVRYEDEAAVAKKLVAAAIADAAIAGPPPFGPGKLLGEAGFPPDGPAMILRHTFPDYHSHARVNAIREALEAAGVRVIPDVRYNGLIEEAKLAMRAAHETYPNMAMVFADDDMALQGASEYRHLLNRKKRRFVLAGYAVEGMLLRLGRNNVTAGLVDRKVMEPMVVAFDTALALAKGETVATDIHTPTPLILRKGPELDGAFPGFLDHPEGMRERGPASPGNPEIQTESDTP